MDRSRAACCASGPQSAGADPGPACYGRGGDRPTVTDAACVLGYLDPERFLGGAMTLDEDAAERVIAALGDALGLDGRDAAAAVLTLAGEHMVGAIREITINQGVDPREALRRRRRRRGRAQHRDDRRARSTARAC